MRSALRYQAKWLLRPLLYRNPPIGLQPERLHLWLDTLKATRNVPGAVLEVGCSAGGTAAFASKMLLRLNDPRHYVCIDTFDGFVDKQFDIDKNTGTESQRRGQFSANGIALVRWVIARHGGAAELVAGDIVDLPEDRLPEQISACLLDVDLSEPVYHGLRRIWPRLSEGGVILVDDCGGSGWQAGEGYVRFCQEVGLQDEQVCKMGFVRRLARNVID